MLIASPYGLSLVVKAPLGTRPKGSEAGACDSNECNEWPTSSITPNMPQIINGL